MKIHPQTFKTFCTGTWENAKGGCVAYWQSKSNYILPMRQGRRKEVTGVTGHLVHQWHSCNQSPGLGLRIPNPEVLFISPALPTSAVSPRIKALHLNID